MRSRQPSSSSHLSEHMIGGCALVAMLLLTLAAGVNERSIVSMVAKAAATDTCMDKAQTQLRVALIGFTRAKANDVSRTFESALAEALRRDPRVVLVDDSMVGSALKGIGYGGSINMSKDEARRLGAAIGCDFFAAGKAEALTRSERENESHEEAYAGLMIVDGRTGALAAFDFISEKASTREAAVDAALKDLDARATGYIDRMIQLRVTAQTPSKDSAKSSGSGSSTVESIEDAPDEDSPRSVGFKPPEFLNRVKPEYTSQAELADITATVEAMVVFRSSGEVGDIDITRWGGFGLDDSAEHAIRQLKFKPATRDGKPISARALIRYNFRRVSEPAHLPEPPATRLPDKPERDLRRLFKPTYRRP